MEGPQRTDCARTMTQPPSPQPQSPGTQPPGEPPQRGGDTAGDVPPEQQGQRWHHPQLAPLHVQYQGDDAEWQDGQGSDVAVTGHDIRMKEFKRAFLRGYAAEDVDTFLMYLAVEMDRRERYYRALTLDEALPVPPKALPAPALDEELFDESDEPETRAAPATAHLPPPPDQTAITADAHEQAEAIIEEARARAERGLERAKDHARQIVTAARQRLEEAERAEAEVNVRVAHLEQHMADRAAALAAEARRLDALAASLAERDLAPALEEYHTPAHAAPGEGADVVRLARTADD